MKQYLLFDLDGTLTDPKVGITTCVQYALASFGIEEPDLDKLEPFIGPPLKDSFMQFYHMDEEQAQAAVEKYRERFRDTGIFENKLYEGVPQMLQALNSKGMFMAVASSKPTVFVERILEHFHIAKYFKVVVGSELDGTRANKDEVVAETLRQLFGDKPVEKEKVYMIGDRSFDAEGARIIGVESVCVTYGYGSMEELKAAKADYIVRSVEELKKFLLRGTDEQKVSPSQRIWQMLFPLLLFWAVRRLGEYLAVMVLQFAGNSVSGGSFLFVRDETGTLTAFTGNASTLIAVAGYVAGTAAIWGDVKRTIQATAEDMKLLHIKGESPKNYLLLGIMTVAAVLGLNMLLELTGITQLSQTYQAVSEGQHSAHLLIGLLGYGLITPIAEELLFRGEIYGRLRQTAKLPIAMVLSALLFGIYHMNPVQGIYGFLMGGLMVYAYEYFGDFKFAVAIHVTSNVLALLMSYLYLPVAAMFNWPVCIVLLTIALGSLTLLHHQKSIF